MQPQSPVATLSPRHYLFQHGVLQLVDGLIHHVIKLQPDQATLWQPSNLYVVFILSGQKVPGRCLVQSA